MASETTKPTTAERADAADRFIAAIERAVLGITEAGAVTNGDLFPGIESRLSTNLAKAQEFLMAAHREAAVQGYDERRRLMAAECAAELATELASLDEPTRETIKGAWPDSGIPYLSRPTFLLAHVPLVRALIDQHVASGEGGAQAEVRPSSSVQGDESGGVPSSDAPAAGSSPGAPPDSDGPAMDEYQPLDLDADPNALVDSEVADRLFARLEALPDVARKAAWDRLTTEELNMDALKLHEVAVVSEIISSELAKCDTPEGMEARAQRIASGAKA